MAPLPTECQIEIHDPQPRASVKSSTDPNRTELAAILTSGLGVPELTGAIHLSRDPATWAGLPADVRAAIGAARKCWRQVSAIRGSRAGLSEQRGGEGGGGPALPAFRGPAARRGEQQIQLDAEQREDDVGGLVDRDARSQCASIGEQLR